MTKKIVLYHGSKDVIEKPKYGVGNPHNDYGMGFYCTEHIELAKEWACDDAHGGFANKYELDQANLKILDLGSNEYNILHWLSLLLNNRNISLDNEVSINAKQYIMEHFPVDTTDVDIIKGYRADDSYFSFARDFLSNSISLNKLSKAMKLGKLGNQVVLISKKAFSQIHFIGYDKACQQEYFPLRKRRDAHARVQYFDSKKSNKNLADEIFVLDIIRNEMMSDDPRLQ